MKPIPIDLRKSQTAMQQREGREEEQRMAMDEQQQPSQSGVDQAQTKAAIGLTASRFQAAPRRNPSPAFAFFPSFFLLFCPSPLLCLSFANWGCSSSSSCLSPSLWPSL